MEPVIQFVIENKEILLTAAGVLWEVFVRIKPSAKDWSIVNIAKRIIDVIPNNAKGGGTHK